MLLFSASFGISVLFCDVKTGKIGSFCVTGRSNIVICSKQKIFRIFWPKGGRSSALFHKMSEGLMSHSTTKSGLTFDDSSTQLPPSLSVCHRLCGRVTPSSLFISSSHPDLGRSLLLHPSIIPSLMTFPDLMLAWCGQSMPGFFYSKIVMWSFIELLRI